MLRDTAVARVKQILGFKQNLDTEIVQAMLETQEMLEREATLPAFLVKDYSAFALVTTVGIRNVNLPAEFIRENQRDSLFVIDPNDTTLARHLVLKDEKDFLEIRYPIEEGNQLPKGYAKLWVNGVNMFQMFPVPDKAYSLIGTFYGKDTTLATNVENGWLREIPELIIAGAGLKIAAGLRDKEALAMFGVMQQTGMMKLVNKETAEEEAGAKRVVGGED